MYNSSMVLFFVRKLQAVWPAVLSLALVACSPLVLVDALVPNTGYQRDADIAYGPEARHRLDVYRPAGPLRSKTAIMFIYGGSWKTGTRHNYRFVGQTLASQGYLVVVPDYRVYPEVRFPRFVEDTAAAVAWVHREIAARGGDPDRIVVAGHSAGAHIAALLALDRRYLRTAGVPDGTIAGLVGLAGPYDFDPLKYSGIRPIFETAEDPDTARPVTFARAGAPPALLIHGTDDGTVRPRNSETLARRLQAAGVPARYVPLVNVGHSGILLSLAEPFRDRAPVVEEIRAFVDGLDRRKASARD